MLNIVIVGTGDIALKRHIPGILQSPSAVLYGFYNRTPSKAVVLAEQYHAKFYASWQQLLADPAVQAVLICTPPQSHEELTVQALAAGKHVLLEKPMAPTLQAAERMAKAAEHSKGILMLLHIQRFYKPHLRAKELLEHGAVGRLLSCRTYLGNADFALLQGKPLPDWMGALSNIGIHRIDLLQYLVGAPASGVFCRRSSLAGQTRGHALNGDDHTAAILEFKNGVAGSLIASRTSFHGEDRSTLLIGTEGTITTYSAGHDLILQRVDGERLVFDFPDSHPQSKLELTNIHELFCQAALGFIPTPVTAMDGAASIRTLEALEASNAEERWIEIG